MASLPKTMKTWLAPRPGTPQDVLELRTDWPTPAPPKGDNILIRMSYAALNPLDLVVLNMWFPFKGSAIPAVDFAGEVIQVGPSVPSDISIGMTVCGTVPTMQILRGVGVLSEYVVLPAHAVTEKPAGLDDASAVGLLGIGGSTGVILVRTANLPEGATALVNGASGGVGVFLVQVLKAKGIHVTGICSRKNIAMVQRLGAEEVVDYTAHESVYDHLSSRFRDAPFDAIFDLMGNEELFRSSPGYLKPDGHYWDIASPKGGLSSTLNSKIPAILGGTPRSYSSVFNKTSGANAKEAGEWFTKGWVKEIPLERFEFDEVKQAYERLASKRAQGKIVVKVH